MHWCGLLCATGATIAVIIIKIFSSLPQPATTIINVVIATTRIVMIIFLMVF